MRIWSLHPKYLDTKGIVALWRETLLAKHVLEGKTKGYKNHPQLIRFKDAKRPLDLINQYLTVICDEAEKRGYNFDRTKINSNYIPAHTNVTKGQIKFETEHLLKKLKTRDPERFRLIKSQKKINAHPIFKVVEGTVEEWEKV